MTTNTLSDPAATAWIIAGRPSISAAPPPVPGICGRCGADGPTVTTTRLFSANFAGFDAWPYGRRRLCVPCAWAYSRKPVTALPMLITSAAVTEYPDGRGLAATLTAGPLPPTAAAILPVRTLRKHRYLLPTAQWGHLAIDRLVLPWDTAAARRLAELSWLRHEIGAHMNDLARAAPPGRLLLAQPRSRWTRIMAGWKDLEPWRATPELWLAAREISDAP